MVGLEEDVFPWFGTLSSEDVVLEEVSFFETVSDDAIVVMLEVSSLEDSVKISNIGAELASGSELSAGLREIFMIITPQTIAIPKKAHAKIVYNFLLFII